MAPRSRGIVRGEKGAPLCVRASEVDVLGFGAKLLTGSLLECASSSSLSPYTGEAIGREDERTGAFMPFSYLPSKTVCGGALGAAGGWLGGLGG